MCILLSSLLPTLRLRLCILLTILVCCSCNPSLTTTSTALQAGASKMASKQHTTRPITTGTSVVGIVYDGGVLLAADTLLSYGSMVKSFNTPRLHSIEDRILIGASGEYSDLQEIVTQVKALALEASTTSSMESIYVDRKLSAKSLWNYLRAVVPKAISHESLLE